MTVNKIPEANCLLFKSCNAGLTGPKTGFKD